MASAIKSKVIEKMGNSESTPSQSGTATPDDGSNNEQLLASRKYLLRVTAGPSYDPQTHHLVAVNDDESPVPVFENEFVTASVRVRIRDYSGLPTNSPRQSSYFDEELHQKDQYSVSFAFVPKQDIPNKDLVWGNDFDHPVRDRLPPGFNTAFKIVKEFIDPGLSCDAYADEPWLYGHALSSWFTFNIGDKLEQKDDVTATLRNGPGGKDHQGVVEGAVGSGKTVREQLQLPDDPQKRRKFYLTEANRENFVFEKDRLYQGDFFNPYLDFNKYALRLPGFSLSVVKYINDKTHHLRYVFKNRVTGDVYFCVIFTLLFGDELKAALESSNDGNSES